MAFLSALKIWAQIRSRKLLIVSGLVQKTRSERMREAGYTRRPKSLPSDE